MPTADQTISVTELRDRLKQVIDACAGKGQRFKILRNNVVGAVIIGPAEWDMLNETMEILGDTDLIRQIIHSEEEMKEDESRPAEEVFEEIEREVEEEGK